jgi:hypothetical protein
MQFNTEKPTKTAIYLVDRDKQGKFYRHYNAETDTWSLCGVDLNEATQNIGKPSAVGFFPWIGPLTGPNYNVPTPKKIEQKLMVTTTVVEKPVKELKKNVAVPVSTAKIKTTTDHPNGSIWYREDRKKWIAMWNGRQEAARPTAEACLKFLKKKYNVDGKVISKD